MTFEEEMTAKLASVVQLQFVGMVPASYARNVRVGDRVMWNGGTTNEVIAIAPKGAKSLSITYYDAKYGEFTRTHRLIGKLAARRNDEWLGDMS